MQITLNNLKQKIDELEYKINSLENKTIHVNKNSGFNIFSKNYLNYQIISKKNISLKTLQNNKCEMFFQLKISFYNFSNQDIKFSLIIDKIQIGEIKNNYSNGNFEAIISGTYKNSIDNNIVISFNVLPKGNKQITLQSTCLTIWGINQTQNTEYSAIETADKFLLTYISNNQLYYKYFNKNEDPENFDFNLYSTASTHSICYDETNNIIYLLRCDNDNNLFISIFNNNNEKYLENNITKISSTFSNSNIQYCFIKNNNCYYGEINNYAIISKQQILINNNKFCDCYIYSNAINNKIYLIATNCNYENYLLESISQTKTTSDNINTSIDFSAIEGNL